MIQSSAMGGINLFLGLLGLAAVGLKLTDQIDWSWWWILGPICIVAAVMVSFKN